MAETSEKIWLSSPHMGTTELMYVQEAFDTNWIAPLGPHVRAFETELKRLTGRYATSLSSGTAAIHLALIVAGVTSKDEVICQSFTFCGTSHPVLYLGATPIFVDSEEETWNMDPQLLEEAILDRIKLGKRPKAIIYVHLYGMPAKVDAIKAVAEKYEIFLIEDAAEAVGSSYKGQPAGSLGDISVLSFNGNKIITTGGGGALLSAKLDIVSKATFLATQARDHAPHYEHSEVGYNYRLSNVSAAIGRGQIDVLPDRIKQRRDNFKFYRKELEGNPGIAFLPEPEGHFSNRWLTTVLIEPAKADGVTREEVRLALARENIESRPMWKPMHLQPVYKGAPAYLNGVSEHLFEKGLCLPSGSNLTLAQLEKVANGVKAAFNLVPKNP